MSGARDEIADCAISSEVDMDLFTEECSPSMALRTDDIIDMDVDLGLEVDNDFEKAAIGEGLDNPRETDPSKETVKVKKLNPFTSKMVEQCDKLTGKVLRRYTSGSAAAAAMDISQSQVSFCVTGRQKFAYGFKW